MRARSRPPTSRAPGARTGHRPPSPPPTPVSPGGTTSAGGAPYCCAASGFLDDPTTPPEVLRSVLAHEAGHWSDRLAPTRVTAQAVLVGVATVGVLPTYVTAPHTTRPARQILATVTRKLMCFGARTVGFAALSWSSELYTDDRAADLKGATTVATTSRHCKRNELLTHSTTPTACTG